MYQSRFRNLLSAILYSVVLFFALWGNYLFVNWSLKRGIGPFFGWFYEQDFMERILVIVFGGGMSGLIMIGLLKLIRGLIRELQVAVLVFNKPAFYLSVLMVSANIFFSVMAMRAFFNWDFWTILIWLLVFYFVIQINLGFIFRDSSGPDHEWFLQELNDMP